MPRISTDERSCAFLLQFNDYVTYYDKLILDNHAKKVKLDQKSFIVQMHKVLDKASYLEPGYISKAITLVDNELKKQLEHDEKQNLPELHAFLIKVQQSERDYFAMLKTEERERDELTSKHDKQRMKENNQIKQIEKSIQLLRDRIEKLKDVKTDLLQKRKAADLQRDQEFEQLRKRQRGD
jgi:hypothetical protein